MFQRILVGYDGSDPSRKALRTALDLAEHYTSEVLAVAVVRTPEVPILAGEIDDAVAKAQGSLTEAFEWARRQAERFEVPLHLHIRAGHPAETLVRMAEEEGCDVIVLGRRGRTSAQRWILGSVSERVLRSAHCPVMVVVVQ